MGPHKHVGSFAKLTKTVFHSTDAGESGAVAGRRNVPVQLKSSRHETIYLHEHPGEHTVLFELIICRKYGMYFLRH